MCLTLPPDKDGIALFTFPDFLTALALLALAFTAADPLYRFRIEVAPIPLKRTAFYASVVTGGGTLLSDLWFAERWPALPWGIRQAEIQVTLGSCFLLIIFVWIWFAFLKRPSFGRWNYRRFHSAILWRMIRGSDVELAAIASEIVFVANDLIESTVLTRTRKRENGNDVGKPGIAEYAHDTLALLGHRKFCRVVVNSASDTALALMHAAIRQQKYSVPLGQFVQNITAEAILNPDSPLYHESRYSLMSVFSRMQPFSQSMYGNYKLVSGIGEVVSSPFDLDWEIFLSLSAKQWETYCSVVLVTFEAYLAQGEAGTHSSILYRAFEHIADAGMDIYKLNGSSGPIFDSSPQAKISASASFASNALAALEKLEDTSWIERRTPPPGEAGHYHDLTDWLADMLYKIILHASAVEAPTDLAWSVHYNTVWSRIFRFSKSKNGAGIVLFKLRRRLYDEIRHMEDFPNFEGARILGICLNVLGVNPARIPSDRRRDDPLRQAVIAWTKRNYVALMRSNPRVAEACLIGSITYDSEGQRIVKTFVQGLRAEPPKSFLSLDMPIN